MYHLNYENEEGLIFNLQHCELSHHRDEDIRMNNKQTIFTYLFSKSNKHKLLW